MNSQKNNAHDYAASVGFALLAFLIIFSFFRFPLAGIFPNLFLVFVVLLSFFVQRLAFYSLFGLVGFLWTRFSPFFEVEYFVLLVISILFFFVFRYFVFSRSLLILIVSFLGAQIVFWAFSYGVHVIISFSFLVEFLYNSVVGLVMYALTLWLVKTSF